MSYPLARCPAAELAFKARNCTCQNIRVLTQLREGSGFVQLEPCNWGFDLLRRTPKASGFWVLYVDTPENPSYEVIELLVGGGGEREWTCWQRTLRKTHATVFCSRFTGMTGWLGQMQLRARALLSHTVAQVIHMGTHIYTYSVYTYYPYTVHACMRYGFQVCCIYLSIFIIPGHLCAADCKLHAFLHVFFLRVTVPLEVPPWHCRHCKRRQARPPATPMRAKPEAASDLWGAEGAVS